MNPIYIDEGNPVWLEPETDEEREFLKDCPGDWSAERCLRVYNEGMRWRGEEIKYLL